MAKKYSSKSCTAKENLIPPKSGKGTKVAAKIMVSMTEKTQATSNSESLNSARSTKHCSHLHCRNPQNEESKGHRHAEVEDSKLRFVDDPIQLFSLLAMSTTSTEKTSKKTGQNPTKKTSNPMDEGEELARLHGIYSYPLFNIIHLSYNYSPN